MKRQTERDEFLTPAGAAKIAGCTAQTIRNAIALPPGTPGALPAIRPGRAILIRREDLDAWLAKPRPRRGRPPGSGRKLRLPDNDIARRCPHYREKICTATHCIVGAYCHKTDG